MTQKLSFEEYRKKLSYKFLMQKFYFDKGYSLTNYFKWAMAAIGFASRDMEMTIVMAGCYALGCYILGRIWAWRKWVQVEVEIQNYFNPYIDDMRNSKIFKEEKIPKTIKDGKRSSKS